MLSLALLYLTAIPAFPGAEGYGAATPGGRGGRTLFVDNLNDSGPGSLREAIDTDGPRIILFRTGGLITLKNPVKITKPFVTIAGQTAPGDGICLKGGSLIVATNDVIIRHIRSRFGNEHGEGDAISVATPSRRVILDHVSASWSVDEALSPSGDIADVTVQWSFITESLNKSAHSKGNHGYGTLARAVGGVTFHHNLWAHHNGRNPRFGDNYGKGEPAFYDFRNNVLYNWGGYCSGLVDGHIRVNYVANYLRYGASSSKRVPIYIGDKSTADTMFYVQSNVVDARLDLTSDNAKLVDRRELITIQPKPFDAPAVKTTSPAQAFEDVLNRAGATKPRRDPVDTRVAKHVRTSTGKIIDTTDEVGGWPAYATAEPPADEDKDGLPDAWERRHKLNPREASDATKLAPSGYTWIEQYLNELADSPQ